MAIVELMVNGATPGVGGNPGQWQPYDTSTPVPHAPQWWLMADNDDGTYVFQAGAIGAGMRLIFEDYAIPANAQVRTVTIKARASKTLTAPAELHATLGTVGTITEIARRQVWSVGAAIADYLSTAWPDPNSGRKWFQDEVNGITMVVSSSPDEDEIAEGMRIHRLSALLDVNHQPTITATGPSGIVLTTSRPTITFTYSDPEGDAMERRRIRVFSPAQIAAPGFDPATSEAFVELLEEFSTSLSWQVPKYLPNGNGWRAYPSAADAGSDGRYSLYGPYTEWSQLVPTPTPPLIVSVTPDTALNRVQLILEATDLANTTHFILERDDGDGKGFQRVLKVVETTPTTVNDYTASRGAPITYRAIAVLDDGNSYSESPPSLTASTTLNSDGKSWLKSTTDPALNIKVHIHATEIDSTSEEDVTFHEPWGRPDPIAIPGTIRLEEFNEIPFFFPTKADFNAFKNLRNRQETLLLQIHPGDGLRDQWFIRFGAARRLVRGGATVGGGDIRMATIEAREVRRPAV